MARSKPTPNIRQDPFTHPQVTIPTPEELQRHWIPDACATLDGNRPTQVSSSMTDAVRERLQHYFSSERYTAQHTADIQTAVREAVRQYRTVLLKNEDGM